MQLTDKEIDSMLTQSPDVRYTYSLKRIADSGYIWYLSSDDDSYMCIQDGDIRLFPVWPFKEYAEKYVSCMRKGHKCNCTYSGRYPFTFSGDIRSHSRWLMARS